MAKGVYIGVDGVARKVKKIYIGVDGVARSVKKAYIGVDGKARLFYYNIGTITRKGTITNLPAYRPCCIGGSVGNYALIAGGKEFTTSSSTDNYLYGKVVSTYNSSLTLGTAENLNNMMGCEDGSTKGESIGNYCIFIGLVSGNATALQNTVYNTSLTKSSVSGVVVNNLMTVSNGTYVIAYGNKVSTDKYIDAYDSSLTLNNTATRPEKFQRGTSARVGNYGVFAIDWGTSSGTTCYIYAYNESLTLTTKTITLSIDLSSGAGATAGSYGLFTGGMQNGKTVLSCSSSLVLSTATDLNKAKSDMPGASLGEYAIFPGGCKSRGYDIYNDIDIYNPSLTHTTGTMIKYRKYFAAANVGNYLLFAGGINDDEETDNYRYFENTTEAFQLTY